MGSVSGAGGQKAIAVGAATQVVVDQFGGFGNGATAAQPGELDTLVFTSAGMTAAAMELTQVGADVRITFQGVPDTQVTLTNLSIEQLENIKAQGNFRFYGENAVSDSVDIWNSKQTSAAVEHANTVTFLNDLADTVGGTARSDTIHGLAGNDTIYGLGSDDRLYGDAGNDKLDGGVGRDEMHGGSGNDTYVVDDGHDQAIETDSGSQGGIDTVLSSVNFTLGANVENLTLTGTADISGTGNTLDNILKGNDGRNTLAGGAGNDAVNGYAGDDKLIGGEGDDKLGGGSGDDSLDGGLGGDRLEGGIGNDTYWVDDAKDMVIESAAVDGGIDKVISTINFALGQYVENLQLAGTADLTGKGNGLANQIFGNAGNNTLDAGAGDDEIHGGSGNDTVVGGAGNDLLDGGAGDDAMSGGTGDDAYLVNQTRDSVSETLSLAQGGGVDTVKSAITYTLGANLENLTLVGAGNLNGTGNTLHNVIIGNDGFNILRGGDGNDRIVGGAGDALRGENGDDTLVATSVLAKEINGGAGNDTLSLDGLQSRIDLTASLTPAVKDVEIIDLTGGHANTLVLDAATITALGEGNPTADGAKTVVVTGDAGDRVLLSLPEGWYVTAASAQPYGLNGQFDKYYNGDVTLLVEHDVHVTMRAPTASVPTLDKLDGSNGFTIDSIDQSLGSSVAAAGDVNGDGLADLIIGARQTGADLHGGGFVIFGRNNAPDHVSVGALDGSNGFSLKGVEGFTGWSVSAAGDLNGDGFGDVAIGAPLADQDASGASFVVFGQDGGFSPAGIDLATLNGSNGFRIDGVAADDRIGWSVSSAGDVNGDGYQDLIVGAYGPDPAGMTSAGSSYVIFGHAGGFAREINLASLNGTNGFRIDGAEAGQSSGISVASAGDVNGDGIDDLIVGAVTATDDGQFSSGAAYVVFGHTGPFDPISSLGALDGSNGFRIGGTVEKTYTGASVTGVGDINGDGFADVAVTGVYAQSTAVIFGHAGGFGAEIDIDTLSASQGLRFTGGPTGLAGQGTWNVSSAGDVNGDGYDDLIIGVPGASPNGKTHAGEVFVVFGKQSFDAPVDLDHLTTATGFKIDGLAAHDNISEVAGVGDLNGDGFDDILIGGYAAEGGKGGGYVIYGANFSGSDVFYGGGTAADESFVGSSLNDQLTGGGGKDSFSAGSGNDLVVLNDQQLLHADGGAGIDGLGLDKAGSVIDLTGTLQGRFESFETINLMGGATNLLKLDAHAVQELVGGEQTPYGPNTLFIEGDSTDTALFTDDWKLVSSDDGFARLTHGALTVIVSSHMHFSGATLGQPVDLNKLDGTNGFKFLANNVSAASAGDVNGDGYDDLLVGANQTSGTLGYIVYGNGKHFPPDLSAKSGFPDVTILSNSASDKGSFTLSVSSAGDLNGDGYDDVILGTPNSGSITLNGTAHVVFGSAAGLGSSFDVAGLNGTNGFNITGMGTGSLFGWSVAGAGDVNGDGYDDMLVGSMGATANTPVGAYLLFGHAGAFAANVTGSDLNGANGVSFVSGAPGTLAGHSVASAGDINGDGYDDIILGGRGPAAGGTSVSGESFVIFGHAGAFSAALNVDSLNGSNGFTIAPIVVNGSDGLAAPAPTNVASAGDLNGDGLADLVIGVYAADPAGKVNAGTTYVVFGQSGGFGATLDLTKLDAAHGFHIDGVAARDGGGWSVAGAGDFNGDGYADLVVSSHLPETAAGGPGEAYVVFGHAGGFDNQIDLAHMSPTAGFQITAPNASFGFGMTVASGGDINGDGFSDLVISDYGNNASYVLFGHQTADSVTHLGDDFGNKLIGTAAAESFVGGAGDDSLEGEGGKDSFEGGSGDDRIYVNDSSFRHVDGGGGNDTLFLLFGGALDFGNLDGNAATSDRGKISGIETISFIGGTVNTTLHLADVLDMNPDNHDVGGNPALDNVLKFDGNAGDTLHLFTADGWSAADKGALAGYAVYTSHDVQIAVDTAIAVSVT